MTSLKIIAGSILHKAVRVRKKENGSKEGGGVKETG
jgi:hypothetical protein